jgi:hypothetical protein
VGAGGFEPPTVPDSKVGAALPRARVVMWVQEDSNLRPFA